MKQFPQALYLQPGVERLESGLFTTMLAHTELERDAALAQGWHTCQEDAKAAFDAIEAQRTAAELAAQEQKDAQEDGNPLPSRAELEQKATELGIAFSPNIGDAKLAQRIGAKLAEPAK